MSINICMDKQNILHAHKQVLLDINTHYGVSDFENFMLGKDSRHIKQYCIYKNYLDDIAIVLMNSLQL